MHSIFFSPALYFSFYFATSPGLPPVVESRGKHPGQILPLCYGNRGCHPEQMQLAEIKRLFNRHGEGEGSFCLALAGAGVHL